MKRLQVTLLTMLVLLLPCVGCTTPMIGKIVDAESGQPIEGAILLIEWTKVHGFGNTYTKSEKAVEVFSDKDGVVNIPGYNDPTVARPDITIYKPGYVAWNNRWIFPDTRKRTDYKWKDGYVFRLERFKEEYSHSEHIMFLDNCIGTGLINNKINIERATQFERNERQKELRGIK